MDVSTNNVQDIDITVSTAPDVTIDVPAIITVDMPISGVGGLKGDPGVAGRNPLTVSATAPSSPQMGDLWYQP